MDHLLEPDRDAIRDKRSTVLLWTAGAALLLLAVWGGTLARIAHDTEALREQAVRLVASRARIYAEQLRRTVKEIDQISLTVAYQWQTMAVPLKLADQYEKAMHHTPTYPAAIGTDGKIVSSWREASIGLDMGGMDFFRYHRDHPGAGLRINPVSVGVGGMAGKRTIRFTRRVDDARGRFAGVVMVSTEPAYLASLGSDDAFGDGDFISVQIHPGPLLVAKTVGDRENPAAYFAGQPHFPGREGVRQDSGASFVDGMPRTIAWKILDDYPLVAVAGVTEASALAAYGPTRAAYLMYASLTTLLVLVVALSGGIAQMRNAERRRKAERVRATFRLAVDGAREAFYMIEPIRDAAGRIADYRIEDCNERAAEMSGLARERLLGRSFSDVYPESVKQWLVAFYNEAFERRFLEDELQVTDAALHQAGWFHRRAVRSGDGIAVTLRDITEFKLHQQTLAKLAVTDTLTGLPNRRWLDDYLPGALGRARSARKRVALLFIDLDNFKHINDTMGHAAGDELLRAAAVCLKTAVRGSDHVVRIGGDEFTVLVENLERDADAELIASQVVGAFAQSTHFARWAAANVKASVGVALYPTHAADAGQLLRQADLAMYAAKTAGKGCYRLVAGPALPFTATY